MTHIDSAFSVDLVRIKSDSPVSSAIAEMADGRYAPGTAIEVESQGNGAAGTSRHFHWFIWTGLDVRKPEELEEYLFRKLRGN